MPRISTSTPFTMSNYPPRPPTPTATIHRLPDHPGISFDTDTKPSKYIILIIASNAIAGKAQIARSVASSLSCPLFQGDSLHKTSARAAGVGAPQGPTGGGDGQGVEYGANEARYQRMWLSRMMRTGYLFPEESRPANEIFSGFGGASSTSTSRRGSASSVASSDAAVSTSSFASSFISTHTPPPTTKYVNKPPATAPPDVEKNPALLVVTHPLLEKWHKDAIRTGLGEHGIGVIFVPLHEDVERDMRLLKALGCFASVPKVPDGTLDEDMEVGGDIEETEVGGDVGAQDNEELPVLRTLDPRTMTSFDSLGSFGAGKEAVRGSLGGELELVDDVDGKKEDDEELPVLKPLDPSTMASFGSLGSRGAAQEATVATLGEEIELRLDVEAKVEDLTKSIVNRVRGIMYS